MRLSLSLARTAQTALKAVRTPSIRPIQTAALAGWRLQSWKQNPQQRSTVESWRRPNAKYNEIQTNINARRQFSSRRPLPLTPHPSATIARTYTPSRFPQLRNFTPRQPSRPKSGPGVLATVQFLSTALERGDGVHRYAEQNFIARAKHDQWHQYGRTDTTPRATPAPGLNAGSEAVPAPDSRAAPESKLSRMIREMGEYNTHLKAARIVMLECLAGREAKAKERTDRPKAKALTARVLQAERLKIEMELEKVMSEVKVIDGLYESALRRRAAIENRTLRARRAAEEKAEESEWEDIEETPAEQERRSVSGVA